MAQSLVLTIKKNKAKKKEMDLKKLEKAKLIQKKAKEKQKSVTSNKDLTSKPKISKKPKKSSESQSVKTAKVKISKVPHSQADPHKADPPKVIPKKAPKSSEPQSVKTLTPKVKVSKTTVESHPPKAQIPSESVKTQTPTLTPKVTVSEEKPPLKVIPNKTSKIPAVFPVPKDVPVVAKDVPIVAKDVPVVPKIPNEKPKGKRTSLVHPASKKRRQVPRVQLGTPIPDITEDMTENMTEMRKTQQLDEIPVTTHPHESSLKMSTSEPTHIGSLIKKSLSVDIGGEVGGRRKIEIRKKTLPTDPEIVKMTEINPDLTDYCIEILKDCRPGEQCDKETLLVRLELQRKHTHNPSRVEALESLISRVKNQLLSQEYQNRQTLRQRQEKQVSKHINRLAESDFKQRISLGGTRENFEVDQQLEIFVNSRQLYRDLSQQPIPTEKLNLPVPIGRGNRGLPKDLQQLLHSPPKNFSHF